MASFNNSKAGKVANNFSVLHIFENAWEWFGLGGGKTVGVYALDKAEQSSAVVDYPLTGGEVTAPEALGGSTIVGEAGLFVVAGGTVTDLAARETCSVGSHPGENPVPPYGGF